MGNEENEGRLLRQVNIQNGQISAVSESMDMDAFRLAPVQSPNQALDVESPVMKRLYNLQAIPAQAPAEADVKTAFGEVGLKVSSSSHKRKKMMAHSADLHAKQTRLKFLKSGRYVNPAPNPDFDTIAGIDPALLMYPQEKGTPYDKYLAHYAELQGYFMMLPGLQAALDSHIASLAKPLTHQQQRSIEEATARLKTLYDIRTYYKTQEALMANKYFSLLPQEEVAKLSYRELRLRLNKLYMADPRNENLIDYYQNQIRLKEVGLSGEKSVNDRVAEYLKAQKTPTVKADTRKPKDVIKPILSAYEKLEKKAADKKSITALDEYKKVFFKFHAADLDMLLNHLGNTTAAERKLLNAYSAYKATNSQVPVQVVDRTQIILRANKPKRETVPDVNDNPTPGIVLTDNQKKSVQAVGSYLLQHTDGHDAFVYNMVQMPPDLQLIALYIIEKGMDESVVGVDYISVLHNYQPDYEVISKKKRDWNVISGAVRTSMKLSNDVKLYGNLTQMAEAKEAQRKPPNAPLPPVIKAQSLVDSIIQHGTILKMLYRSAGLQDDMPPDMAQDPVIRKKMFDEYQKIISFVRDFSDISLPDNNFEIAEGDYNNLLFQDRQKVEEKDSSITQKDVQESIADTNKYAVGYVFGGIKSLIGSFITGISGETAGAVSFVTSNSIGGATAIFGLVAAISSSVAQYQSRESRTEADKWALGIGNSGDYTKVLAGGLTVAGSFTNLAQGKSIASAHYLKGAGDALWTSSSTANQLLMWGGITTMVAGSVKMVASGIQTARSVSNKNDVIAAKQTITTKLNNHQALTPDEEQLKLLLSHRERSIKRETTSAAMGIVSGAMTVIAGGFMMSGYLAPIGAIVGLASLTIDLIYKGIDYRKKKRNQKKAVDEFLNIDNLVQQVKGAANHPMAAKIQSMKDDVLKEKIREEALAMLGYTSYEQCFKERCVEMARFLYRKVFEENPPDPNIADYEKAISSFGLKVQKPLVVGGEGKPSIEAMVTKLMG